MEFLKNIKDYIRNPLGIIALFISLIYGFANLLFSNTVKELESPERWPLIIFIVVFPVVVLRVFYVLVTKHHWKLYSPKDFNSDDSFLSALTPEKKYENLKQEAKNLVQNNTSSVSLQEEELIVESTIEKIKTAEDFIISEVEKELGITPKRDITISPDSYEFDAGFSKKNHLINLDIKYYSESKVRTSDLEKFIQKARLTKEYMNVQTSFIFAIVCDLKSNDINSLNRIWKEHVLRNEDIDLRLMLVDLEKVFVN